MFSFLFSPPNFHYVKPVLWTWRKMTFILWEHDLQRVNFLLCEQITKKKTSLVIKAHFFLCSESWFHHVNESSRRLLSSSTNQEKRLDCICCCSVLHLAFAQTHLYSVITLFRTPLVQYAQQLVFQMCWSQSDTAEAEQEPHSHLPSQEPWAVSHNCMPALFHWPTEHLPAF